LKNRLIVLTTLALLWLAPAPSSESTSDEPFLVWVVGLESSVQTSTKHAISASGVSPRVVDTTQQPADDLSSGALADLLRTMRRREDEARALASQLGGRVAPGARWVTVSPDRRYALVGFEDPQFDVMRTADLVNMASRERLKNFVFWWSESIAGAEWSKDSRLLGVLIGRERWSLAPLDLVLTVLGKPTPLKTYSVSLIDLPSLREQRVPVATDVRFGTSTILRNTER